MPPGFTPGIPGAGPEFIPGEPVSLEEMQRMADFALTLARREGYGAGGLDSDGPFASHPVAGFRFGFTARITALAFPYYSFTEVFWSGTQWATRTDGYAGVFNAREFNNNSQVPADPTTGAIVWMWCATESEDDAVPFIFVYPGQTLGSIPSGSGSSSSSFVGPGPCHFARLRFTDCLLATSSNSQRVYLTYQNGVWSSDDGLSGTQGDQIIYPAGTGYVKLWFEAGQIHLSLGEMEMISCGNGCWTGGVPTGHAIELSGSYPQTPCTGETITICVECAECQATATVTVPCCAEPMPQTLHVTATGDCSGSGTILWDGEKWTGIVDIGANSLTLAVYCYAGDFYCYMTGCYFVGDPDHLDAGGAPLTGTCESPTDFSIGPFSMPACCAVGMGLITLTITE